MAISLTERFMQKVICTSECWEWDAARDHDGYGRFWFYGKSRKAHRIAYEMFIGPVPEEMTIDHRCRNRGCVNPMHLEVVPFSENVRRGDSPNAVNKRKLRCKHGHPFDWTNTYIYQGRRQCRACKNERKRRERHGAFAHG